MFGAEKFFAIAHGVELVFLFASGKDVIILCIKFSQRWQRRGLGVTAIRTMPNARGAVEQLAEGGDGNRPYGFVNRGA